MVAKMNVLATVLVVVFLVCLVTGDDDKKKDDKKSDATTVSPPVNGTEKCICKFARCEHNRDCCSGRCMGGDRSEGFKQCRPVFGNECDACKQRANCIKKDRSSKKKYTFTIG